jgi:hypothetical protein
MARVGSGQPLEFLSTHPSHESRLEELEAAMGKALAVYQQALGRGVKARCG